MSWKTIAVLLIHVLALGGYFYYDTYWLLPARDKAESVKGRLWSVEPKDVEGLSIKRATDTIRLKRVDDGWEMLEPVKARGDRGPVDEVVLSLTTARVDREVAANPAKLDEFGLDPATAEVRLDVKGRSEPLTLLVGAKSPTGAWVYAKEAGKPAIVTLSEVTARDVARPAADFRDKTVVAFDKKAVTAIDLEVEGQQFSVEAAEPGKWRIVKPAAYQADAEMIADLLDKLEGAKVKEFVADGAPLSRYGLDKPARVTLWIGKDKDRVSKAVSFGAADSAKQGVYVMRDNDKQVLLAPEDVWKAVPKTVAALRDKVVVAYAYDKANRVQVDSARGTVTLEKDGSTWKITAPEALKADSTAVSNLLWRIRDLRATGFVGETPEEAARLLGKPEVTVRIWEEGAKEPKTLLVRPFSEKRGGTPAAVAAVEGKGPVALVDARAVEDLSRTASDLRDRSIFPAFELAEVKRTRIAGGGKVLVVDRGGDSEWKVVEPSRGPAKAPRVDNVLLTLKALRWKEIVSPDGADAARYGLDRPEVEVALAKEGGADIGSLLVGRREGEVSYVRLKAAPAIYAVDDKLVADLRKASSDIPG
jgi:hypothetical protein